MFNRFAIATFVIWLAASAALIYLSSAAVMSGPRDGESYAYSWSYQLESGGQSFGPQFCSKPVGASILGGSFKRLADAEADRVPRS